MTDRRGFLGAVVALVAAPFASDIVALKARRLVDYYERKTGVLTDDGTQFGPLHGVARSAAKLRSIRSLA